MKLSVLAEDRRNRRTRVAKFDYPDKTEHGPTHDQKPQVLFLGGWWHPTTGNRLFGGINLNYLSEAQLDRLRRELPKIFGRRGNLQTRARAVEALIPDIFDTAYRTYNRANMSSVTLDTVHFIPPEEADKKLNPKSAMQPEPPKDSEQPAPETPEIPEMPEPDEDAGMPEPDENAPGMPEPDDNMPSRPEGGDLPPRPKPDSALPDVPAIPSVPSVKPTSQQRRSSRPEAVRPQAEMPSSSVPSIRVKPTNGPVQKPTSYQRRNGILGNIKDKISGWGTSLGNILTKWRKKKPG